MPIASISNTLLRPFHAIFQPREILVLRNPPPSGLAPSDPCRLASFPADSMSALVPMPIQHIPPPPLTPPLVTPLPPPSPPRSIDEEVAMAMADTDRLLREVEETLVESAEFAADMQDLAIASRRVTVNKERRPSPVVHWEIDISPQSINMDWGSDIGEEERLRREHGDLYDPNEELELHEEISSLELPSSWSRPHFQLPQRRYCNIVKLYSGTGGESSSVLWDAMTETTANKTFRESSPIDLPSPESSFDEAKHAFYLRSRQSMERVRCIRGLSEESPRSLTQDLMDEPMSDEEASALPPPLVPPPLPPRSLRRINGHIPERQARVSTNDNLRRKRVSLTSKLKRLRPLITPATQANRPQFAKYLTVTPETYLPPSPLWSESSIRSLSPRQLSPRQLSPRRRVTWELSPWLQSTQELSPLQLSPREFSPLETPPNPQILRKPPHRDDMRPGDWSPPGLWFGSPCPSFSSSIEEHTQHPEPTCPAETEPAQSPIKRPTKRRASNHEEPRSMPILTCIGGCGKEFFQVQSPSGWNGKKREIMCSDCGEWVSPEHKSEPEEMQTPTSSSARFGTPPSINTARKSGNFLSRLRFR